MLHANRALCRWLTLSALVAAALVLVDEPAAARRRAGRTICCPPMVVYCQPACPAQCSSPAVGSAIAPATAPAAAAAPPSPPPEPAAPAATPAPTPPAPPQPPAVRPQAAAPARSLPSEYQPLFNGVDLAGWHGMTTFDPRKLDEMTPEERQKKLDEWNATIPEHWTVVDGVIENDGFGAYLTTDAVFGDYELLVDYKTVPKADSGIYLRGTPQVQIWDHTNEAQFKHGCEKGSGGLWNNTAGAPGKDPLVLADKPFGEWNTFRVVQTGARTSVWLNDQQVVDHAVMENYFRREQPLYPTGPIQLQTHGGPISWRNIGLRPIAADEANAILREHSGEGFQSLFNGTDLTGWQGATDSYEVVDGAIRCKTGQGGVLHTSEEYGDFVARLEFRLPPGGNNGLAIRYPGEGDTAYVGMCELQVLDTEHEKYGKLDPRQAHGSAYGMVAAHRGYLRPAGEWNFQVVTVKGSTIQVELNGSRILDADLSQVTEYLGDRPHPGKDRTSGFFGFAGHSDPVEFRRVEIKRLAAE